MKLLRPLLHTAVGLLWALTASAQWQWTDQAGRQIFSDRPPPSDIPDRQIVKRPGSRSAAPAPAAAAASVAPAAAGSPAGLDKTLEAKKKQADAEEAAKRKADEERVARVKAENCSRAQQAKAGLDAGGRMARTNEKGEREFMDEAAIAAEAQRVQSIINENCY